MNRLTVQDQKKELHSAHKEMANVYGQSAEKVLGIIRRVAQTGSWKLEAPTLKDWVTLATDRAKHVSAKRIKDANDAIAAIVDSRGNTTDLLGAPVKVPMRQLTPEQQVERVNAANAAHQPTREEPDYEAAAVKHLHAIKVHAKKLLKIVPHLGDVHDEDLDAFCRTAISEAERGIATYEAVPT